MQFGDQVLPGAGWNSILKKIKEVDFLVSCGKWKK
jgi:hypothetical protein